ncbi:MAG: DUF4031 domain-containing protein [Gemmatimonadales bacterium]|nr:MAG: DUF4031 domain-containing protein [Gemmatimonadales bacterium]
MIKYHFHTATREVPRLGAHKGDRLCHVYSDRSVEELLAWGATRNLRAEWMDRRNVLPHFDVLGESVAKHEPGVGRSELVVDIRWWRNHQATSGRPRARRAQSASRVEDVNPPEHGNRASV